MATEQSVTNITLEAGTGVGVYTGVPGMPGSADPNTGVQYHFVKLNGGREVVLAEDADTTEVVVGVLGNKPQAVGQPATVAISGVSLVMFGDDVTAGDPVKVEDGGRAVTATLPTDAGLVVGLALEGGGDGEIGSVLLKLRS